MSKRRRTSPNPGLTPPELVSKIRQDAGVSDGDELQDLRKPDPKPKKPLLSSTRKKGAGKTGGGGVFGADRVPDSEREAQTSSEGETVSDPRRSRVASIRDLLEIEIKKTDPDGIGGTYLQTIVQKVVEKAANGEQWAMLFVRDIIEGKPGQAPKRTQSVEDIEETISQVELATLNKFLEIGES
jgi:hypothetical protein